MAEIISHKSSAATLMLVLLMLAPMTGIGIDLYAPSLPFIVAALKTTPTAAKLTITAYLIGYGLGQPFYGAWTDSRGRRKTLLFALLLYFFSSLAAGFAFSLNFLLVMRVLQGLAVAAISTITKGVAVDVFTGKRLARVSNFMVASWAVGPIVGPVIGSYLQAYFDWRMNFYFLALYGFIALLLAWFFLPETHLQRDTFNLSRIYKNYRNILSVRQGLLLIFDMTLMYALLVIFSVLAPFLIQKEWGYSVVMYGYIALLMGVAFCLGNVSNVFLTHKYSNRWVIYFSAAGLLFASFVLFVSSWFITKGLVITTVFLFLVIYFSGIVYPNHLGQYLNLFSSQRAASASAILGCFMIIGTGILSALAGVLHPGSLIAFASFYFILIVFYSLILTKIKL